MHSQYTTLQAAALLNAVGDPWVKEYLKAKRIKDVDKELKLLTNKINRLKREVEASEKANAGIKPRSVEDMVADMQLAFGYQIDADKMTTKQWIALQQKAKEQNKNQKN